MNKVSILICTAIGMAGCMPQDGVSQRADAVHYELSVERVTSQLYNPWTLRDDAVEVRAFRDEASDALVAPTMRVWPGQVLRLDLENNLPACDGSERLPFACFNATNIHTHGLWVSPSGNSDNVMLSIGPGERFEYEFAIPDNHPAGTFWYHPHIHGGTSVHLGSGMAGALIIDGDRQPTSTSPGDIDILFSQRFAEPFGEHILVFSQIQYGCYDDHGQLNAPRSSDPDARPWEHPAWARVEADLGTVDSWDQFRPRNEMTSGRFIGINGEIQPTLTGFETGRFQRLRMIHAGLRRSVNANIRQLAPDAPDLRDIPAADHISWIEQYCTGEPIDQFHFADDGLTRSSMRQVDEARFYPGSRFDSLVYFEEPGTYCIVNDQGWRMVPDDKRMLGLIEVEGESERVDNVRDHLTDTLVMAAELNIRDDAMRRSVTQDLTENLNLHAFVWHEPVLDEELTGRQTATLSIVEHEMGGATLSVDGVPFEHGRVDRTLMLGDVDEWEITSNLANHPFHIHVNPFQIISIVDPDGNDVTIEGSPHFDPDYAGMIGGWRDTVIVKRDHILTMRTRYRRFVGDFVLHCHFASHGDEGMMQTVRVATHGDMMSMPLGH